jgi:transcriptional regulator with XRE-family HTH domain
MGRIMGSILTETQGSQLPAVAVTFRRMPLPSDLIRAAFSARMHEICDNKDVPVIGRQVALARVFGVTNKAARRWLEGLGYPEMAMAVRIADWADVNLTWLLQGSGPKRGNRVDGKALVLDEAMHALTREQGTDLIDSLRAKLVRVGKISAEEPDDRFQTMLAAYEREFARKRH